MIVPLRHVLLCASHVYVIRKILGKLQKINGVKDGMVAYIMLKKISSTHQMSYK